MQKFTLQNFSIKQIMTMNLPKFKIHTEKSCNYFYGSNWWTEIQIVQNQFITHFETIFLLKTVALTITKKLLIECISGSILYADSH